jgi:hypothetical protein
MIASEVMVPPDLPSLLEPVTVTAAVELTGPLNAVALAVIVVDPAATAVTRPAELTVATDGALEVQVTPDVIACVVAWFALPNVPVALN